MRIRVAAADGAIVRYENGYDGTLRGYIETTAREVGRPLADSELGHEVPLMTRYSPGNNLPVFVSALFVVTAIAGLAFWTWFFARAESPEDVASVRRRLWRLFAWALAAVATLLGFLTVVTWGGSGHPPAIVYVMVMAMLAAIGFGLAACFLLMSYLGQVVAGRSKSEDERGTWKDDRRPYATKKQVPILVAFGRQLAVLRPGDVKGRDDSFQPGHGWGSAFHVPRSSFEKLPCEPGPADYL